MDTQAAPALSGFLQLEVLRAIETQTPLGRHIEAKHAGVIDRCLRRIAIQDQGIEQQGIEERLSHRTGRQDSPIACAALVENRELEVSSETAVLKTIVAEYNIAVVM